jgi:hypothetical protein
MMITAITAAKIGRAMKNCEKRMICLPAAGRPVDEGGRRVRVSAR